MALMRDLSRAQLAFQVTGLGIDTFEVIRYRGTEGLCQLYRFEIEMASREQNLALDTVVGKPAVLSINTSTGERWFHGIIGRFEMTGETTDQSYYRAELVPAVWLLTHRYCSRIFQNKGVKDIISEVLTQAGIPSDRFDMARLDDSAYPAREYCVQYRETDYNFIARLMEEAGIWWHFEQAQDKHVLVLGDKTGDYTPIVQAADLPYHPPAGMNVEEEHVYRFRISQVVRPGAVALNDFNFENPPLDLEAKADNGRDKGLEFADFPGDYRESSTGLSIAGTRAQEFDSGRLSAVGMSNCKRLGPGRTFELKDHPNSTLNTRYLVTAITHEGKEAVRRTSTGSTGRGQILDPRVHQAVLAARSNDNPQIRELAEALLQIAARLGAGDPTANRALTQWLYHAGQVSRDLPATAAASGGNPLEWLTIPNLIADLAPGSIVDFDAPVYQCRFECIPASVTYRPPRVTPGPVMRGTQTARVVGPDGEEIHVDKYGRVKVQFHWDRQGSEGGQPKKHGAESSCWIRVCQGWAGGQYGMMFIPRVGQEVVVDFLEGDPDQPIIIGRVYNADHMPPYPLPDEKTKSCIKTGSSKGGGGCNEIRFEDLKDREQLLIQAQRQMDTRIKASHFHTVGGSYHLLVGGEKDGQLAGEYREKVFKAKHVHVKGELRTWVEEAEGRAVGGEQSIEIQGVRTLLCRDDAIETYEANHKTETTGTDDLSADGIKREAQTGIELKCGGSSIVIAPGGVWIKGPMVYINSGSGAPVPAASVAGQCPAAAEDAAGADASKPGKDTRYSGSSATTPSVPILDIGTDVPGEDFDKPTFIEFQLLDAEENPVPNENYRVELPDGSIRTGVTDGQGVARFEPVPDLGVGYIQLTNRFDAEWRFLRVVHFGPGGTAPSGGSGGASTGGSGSGSAPGAGSSPASGSLPSGSPPSGPASGAGLGS